MRKITRMVLISAVLATSGLTAKIATENYKAVATNDERLHKAYELAKKPNKAAVLEAIVDATNAESDERIQKAVVLESEEPKTPKVVRVRTSAGVSPIASVMDKKTINKAEEFIENIAHPAEVVMKENLDFTTENIPVQELVYQMKDIFPEFKEEEVAVEEVHLSYRFTLPETPSSIYNDGANDGKEYIFDVAGERTNDGTKLNYIRWDNDALRLFSCPLNNGKISTYTQVQAWITRNNDSNIVKFDPETRTVDYSALVQFKDSDEKISGLYTTEVTVPTCKEVYEFLAGVENDAYRLLIYKNGSYEYCD